MSRVHPPKPPDDKPHEPEVVTHTVCPNCGRPAAVVFPVLSDGDPAAGKLVCLSCCPTPADQG